MANLWRVFFTHNANVGWAYECVYICRKLGHYRPLSPTKQQPTRRNKIRSNKRGRERIHTLKWGKKWARTQETNAHNVKCEWIFFVHSLIWLKPKQSNVKNVAGGYWRVSLIMWLKLVLLLHFWKSFSLAISCLYIFYQINTIQMRESERVGDIQPISANIRAPIFLIWIMW